MKEKIDGYFFKSSYIAKVTGKDVKFGLKREFVKPDNVHSIATYTLQDGIYEIKNKDGKQLILVHKDKKTAINQNQLETLFQKKNSKK